MTFGIKLRQWVRKHGRKNAGALLVTNGVHIDTAIRLINGTYLSEPKAELMDQIKKAMAG